MNPSRLLPLFALCASCASSNELEPDPLSYHLAVLPIETATIGRVTPGEHPGGETELVLELAGEEVHVAVAEALEEYCFTEVTLLTADGPTEAMVSATSREQQIVRRAREAQADLVLELSLRYEPSVYRDTNSSFWLNFPLFLFAGPTNWFISDNTYYADVELTSSLYDARSLEAGLSLDDPAARILTVSSKFSGVALDFIDRADGATDYALGIIIPSGFLARENDEALLELKEEILTALCDQTVQGLQSRRNDLVRAEYVAPFYIEPAEVSLTRLSESQLSVSGLAQLQQDGHVDRLTAVRMSAGKDEVSAHLGEDQAGAVGHDAISFEAVVDLADGEDHVRIVVSGGGRDYYERSYTFAVPAVEER